MRYSIEGEPLPVVICNLEQGEVMITESGAMSWMSPNMKMETTGGGIGKMSCCCIQRGSVRVLSAENRERTFRRRGIYYAEAFRKWNRISGI